MSTNHTEIRAAFGNTRLGAVSIQETADSALITVLRPALVTRAQQEFLDAHKTHILPRGSEQARATYYLPLGEPEDVGGSGTAPAGKAPQAAVA